MFEILPKENIKSVFEKLGRDLKQLHQERMRNQIGVDGSPYPALKPATIEQKRRMGGGIEANAEQRMIRTGDFQKQAFEWEVKDNSFTFFVSKKPHKQLKIKAKKQARITNKKKGWNVSAPPKMSKVSYKDIALYNMNEKFNFFGLNDREVKEYVGGAFNKLRAIAEKNIKTELKNILQNGKNK